MGRDMGRIRGLQHGQRNEQGAMAQRTLSRLSANLVKALAERGYYADGGGLYFRVSEFGTRLWAFRYTRAGKARELGLGPCHRGSQKLAGESITHVVKPGETLGGIARKYQVSVGEIATANNITDPAKIRPGRELAIPGWKSPAVKAAAVAPTEKTVGPSPAAPVFTLPPPGQDLDKGFKSTGDAPVIKVEEASPFSSN